MAKKGLSRLFFAKYTYTPEAGVKYTDGCETEKLASYSIETESSDDSDLYLNNGIAESEKGRFTTGTLTHSTGDLNNETSKMILGVKEKQVTVDGIDDPVEEIVLDDDFSPVDCGVGMVELHQTNGVEFYRSIVLARVAYNMPNTSANTRGESVEWQTQEATAKIKRSDLVDDNYNHPWQFHADLKTEEDAVKYIKHKLNMTEKA